MIAESVALLLKESLKKLIVNMVAKVAGDEMKNRYKRWRIIDAVERHATGATESLEPYFAHERISEDAQRLVVEACMRTLQPLVEEPDKLFRGSLDTERVFLLAHPEGKLPEEVVQEGVGQVYTLVARHVCSLLCAMPVAIEGWEQAKWREDYRRLDEIVAELRDVSTKLDESERARFAGGDRLLAAIQREQEQQHRLNLTGLRADRPLMCSFDVMFVEPALELRPPEARQPREPIVLEGAVVPARMLEPAARSVVMGAPGAGKTTWCHWLRSVTVAGQAPRVAVLLHLRSVDWSAPPGLPGLLREAAGPHLAEQISPEHITRWIDRRAVVVLVDGFDEVAPSLRPQASAWLQSLARTAGRCPVVVTSRPIATDELRTLDASWTQYELLPFDEQRIVRFIDNWLRHAWPADAGGTAIDAPALAAAWEQDPTISPLTGNPLLLSTLLVVHKLDGQLPDGRAKLYQRYVHGMIGIWARDVATPGVSLTDDQKRVVLTDLALDMHLREVDELNDVEALSVVQESLRQQVSRDAAEVVLRMLCERTGLFVGPGTYSFTHKSIGEYLVAEAVVQGDRADHTGRRIDRLRLREERHNDRWKTVMFLWMGMAPVQDAEEFLKSLLPLTREDVAVFGGLLSDQGHRFTLERRRSLWLAMLTSELEVSPDLRQVFVSVGGVKQPHADQPLTTLSSHDLPLSFALCASIRRGDLPWQWPMIGISDAMELTYWIALVRCAELAEVSQIVALVSEQKPPSGVADWVVASVVAVWLHKSRNPTLVIALVDAVATCSPSACVSAVLGAMHVVADGRVPREQGVAVIAELADQFDHAIDLPHVHQTRHVVLRSPAGIHIGDLLTAFDAHLQALPADARPAGTDRCLALSKQLRALRDQALPAPPPSAS